MAEKSKITEMGVVTPEVKSPQDSKDGARDDIEATAPKKSHRTSNLETATHLFKGSVGAGLFAMGDGFKNAGLVGATVLLPVIAVVCVHCEHLLISGSKAAVQKTPGATFFDFPETVQKCFEYGPQPLRRFSNLMKLIVETFLFVTQFGFCAIYFVFITENLHQVLQQNGVHINENVLMCIMLLPAMLPSLLTNLRFISPISMFANFALLFGLFATLVIALQGPMPAPTQRHLYTNSTHLALFFGTALFAFEGVALVLPLRNSMRKPENFTHPFGVLNMVMVLFTFLSVFTGFVSYMRWGEDVQGSVTLNLDVHNVMSQVVKVMSAMGVFFGYPIQFFIMIKIIWKPIKKSSSCAQQYPITMQVLLRFIMVLLTFGMALAVPKLSLFISLIGAMCSTSLTLLIPVMIDMVVRSQIPKGLNGWVYLKNSLIIAVAILGIITGTYQSIVEIVHAF